MEWTRICFLRDYTSFQTGDHAPTRYFQGIYCEKSIQLSCQTLSLAWLRGKPVNFRPSWPNIVKKCVQDLATISLPPNLVFLLPIYSFVRSFTPPYFHFLSLNSRPSHFLFVVFDRLLFSILQWISRFGKVPERFFKLFD